MPRGVRKTLRVYGWTAHFSDENLGKRLGVPEWVAQCRAIVAATSKSEVARLAGAGYPAKLFNLCETGNAVEIGIARAQPGRIFVAPIHGPVEANRFLKYDADLYGRLC